MTELPTIGMAVQSGSSDVLTMAVEGVLYSASFPSVLGLNQGFWDQAEFNVFGDGGGSEVTIEPSNGTSLVTAVSTAPFTNTVSCSRSANGAFTVETNSLTLVPNCCMVLPNDVYPTIEFLQSNVPGQSCTLCGGEGQVCCASNTCTAAGAICQLGTCGAPNVLVADPSSLSVEAGDGTVGGNSAVTHLEASGLWANNPNVLPPALAFTVTEVPPGVPLPPPGMMPEGVSIGITNDINPPTVTVTAVANNVVNTVPGVYKFAITGTVGLYKATATLTLTVGACQPVTCAAAGWVCGSFDNECGGTANCGTCPAGEACTGGTCVPTCHKFCAPPEFLNPSTCQCQTCQCGTIIVNGHRICNKCGG
jgi:hypothetical protein